MKKRSTKKRSGSRKNSGGSRKSCKRGGKRG